MPLAVNAYNSNLRSARMNSAPEDVKDTFVLQYELEKRRGLDAASSIIKLRVPGAFRILLPRNIWNRAGQPRYNEKVYAFLHKYGQESEVSHKLPPTTFLQLWAPGRE